MVNLRKMQFEDPKGKCPKCNYLAYYRVTLRNFRCVKCALVFDVNEDNLFKTPEEEINFYRRRSVMLFDKVVSRNRDLKYVKRKLDIMRKEIDGIILQL